MCFFFSVLFQLFKTFFFFSIWQIDVPQWKFSAFSGFDMLFCFFSFACLDPFSLSFWMDRLCPLSTLFYSAFSLHRFACLYLGKIRIGETSVIQVDLKSQTPCPYKALRIDTLKISLKNAPHDVANNWETLHLPRNPTSPLTRKKKYKRHSLEIFLLFPAGGQRQLVRAQNKRKKKGFCYKRK